MAIHVAETSRISNVLAMVFELLPKHPWLDLAESSPGHVAAIDVPPFLADDSECEILAVLGKGADD